MLTRPLALVRPLLLPTLLLPTLAWSQGLRFTTLDIGQGDSAVLITPGGPWWRSTAMVSPARTRTPNPWR
jgi:hypothetical protein